MTKKIFVSKKELLKFLGKDEKNVRVVDRMMLNNEVKKVEGGYELIEKVDPEEVRRLIEEKEELIKKVFDLEFKIEVLESNNVSIGELKEATAQWHFYEESYELEVEDKNKRIKKCFQWIKARNPKANWDEFYEWVMSEEE